MTLRQSHGVDPVARQPIPRLISLVGIGGPGGSDLTEFHLRFGSAPQDSDDATTAARLHGGSRENSGENLIPEMARAGLNLVATRRE